MEKNPNTKPESVDADETIGEAMTSFKALIDDARNPPRPAPKSWFVDHRGSICRVFAGEGLPR